MCCNKTVDITKLLILQVAIWWQSIAHILKQGMKATAG